MVFEYVVWLAMAFGFFTAMNTSIWENSKQIRRNSETIRRQCEARLRSNTAPPHEGT